MKINLLLVDDHPVLRKGLSHLISSYSEIGKIEEAANGLEAVLKAEKNMPDIVVMDYDMPIYNGIYGTRELLKLNPSLPVLLLSMFRDKDHILEAIHAGVKGFVSKDAQIEEVMDAIRALHEGRNWFKGNIAETLISDWINNLKGQPRKEADQVLTIREIEIVKLFAEGNSSTEIATILSISNRTVQVHKANIFKKLGINNNTQLIKYAIRNNILKMS